MVPIKLGGASVYGVVAAEGVELLVRVTADEFERLGHWPGSQVRVEALGHNGVYVLAAAEDNPPFVFLRLTPLEGRVAG